VISWEPYQLNACIICHLTLVMFLHYLTFTQKLKRDIDKLKHWHFGPYSSRYHRQSHWPMANTAIRTRVKATGRHFEHLYCDLATQPALFRSTRATCQIGCFQSILRGRQHKTRCFLTEDKGLMGCKTRSIKLVRNLCWYSELGGQCAVDQYANIATCDCCHFLRSVF